MWKTFSQYSTYCSNFRLRFIIASKSETNSKKNIIVTEESEHDGGWMKNYNSAIYQ
jgi:hypothetical protein